MASVGLLLTCEHGGCSVPAECAALFRGAESILAGHRGYDPGALALAERLSKELAAQLVASTVTRLLVELNRSPRHRALFSEFTRGLPRAERDALLDRHYRPYRETVECLAEKVIEREGRVVHVSVHTFTPELNGVQRTADVGLLYDPRRPAEGAFCGAWLKAIRRRRSDLRLRRNYPYLGRADGFTTHLRRRWPDAEYAGIELEVNQRWPLGNPQEWSRLQQNLAASLDEALRTARSRSRL